MKSETQDIPGAMQRVSVPSGRRKQSSEQDFICRVTRLNCQPCRRCVCCAEVQALVRKEGNSDAVEEIHRYLGTSLTARNGLSLSSLLKGSSPIFLEDNEVLIPLGVYPRCPFFYPDNDEVLTERKVLYHKEL